MAKWQKGDKKVRNRLMQTCCLCLRAMDVADLVTRGCHLAVCPTGRGKDFENI